MSAPEKPAQPSPDPAEMQARLDDVLLRVGRLNYVWSNTESLLIHLIAGLTGMTQQQSVVVFLSLGGTKGRVDLVERLAKLDGTDSALRDRLLPLMGRFSRLSASRNRYNHSIWSFAEDGSISTILMRIADRRDRIRMGAREALDDEELRRIDTVIQDLSELNREIWLFLQETGFPIE